MENQESKDVFEEAQSNYKKNPDDPECQYNLACCYHWRIGAEANFTEAARLYELAKSKVWEASTNLGILYLYGHGVPKDELRAATLLKTGVEHGDTNAMAALGGIFLGPSSPLKDQLDPTTAINWLIKAEQGNHPVGTHNLALAYLTGQGVEPDLKKAHALFLKGAKLGNELSLAVLKDLQNKGVIGNEKI